MNRGRGWRGGFRPMTWNGNPRMQVFDVPPMFRGGFGPPPRAFFPCGPSPWRRGGPRGRGGDRLSHRGGIDKRGSRGKTFQKNKPGTTMPGKRLTEKDIGVTEYIGSHEGFSGIIKSRYSDFQVSEINEEGEVAQLTTEEVPEPPKRDEFCDDEDVLLNKYNLELLPLETWDSINSLVLSPNPTKQRVEVDVTGMSKEERTKIHDAVKKAFGDSIVGSTVTTNDKKLVRFEKYRKGVRIDNRVKWLWPGEFVRFIVHKENCDTMDAATKISTRLQMLNVKPAQLGYAGTKDRRGKTSQWFSLKRIEPKRISNACANLREIHVGNFTFSKQHLKLGSLKGNRFRIALRNVTAPDDAIIRACESLKSNGFLNYYGLQRFGTRIETPTYNIGLKLLQGNFQEAVKLILGDCDQQENSQGPLERRLLKSLAKNPNDFVGAIAGLARNIRLLYVHSYQSLLWNKCVSERIKKLGPNAVPGDLVLVKPHLHKEHLPEEVDEEDEEKTNGENETEVEQTSTETEVLTEVTETAAQPDTQIEEQTDEKLNTNTDNQTSEALKGKGKNKLYLSRKPSVQVHVLTEEDIASGKYSLRDVVLPLPGYNIQYPPNMLEYYTALLTGDNLTLELKHKIPSYSLSGAYRLICARADDLTWEIVRYTDPVVDLILSDLDVMYNKQLNTQPDGKYKALLLTMTLPASCYATMALRELIRIDTSGEAHAKLNDYYLEKTAVKVEAENVEQKENVEQDEKGTENCKEKKDSAEETTNGDGTIEEREKRKLEDTEQEVDSKRSKLEE